MGSRKDAILWYAQAFLILLGCGILFLAALAFMVSTAWQ